MSPCGSRVTGADASRIDADTCQSRLRWFISWRDGSIGELLVRTLACDFNCDITFIRGVNGEWTFRDWEGAGRNFKKTLAYLASGDAPEFLASLVFEFKSITVIIGDKQLLANRLPALPSPLSEL